MSIFIIKTRVISIELNYLMLTVESKTSKDNRCKTNHIYERTRYAIEIQYIVSLMIPTPSVDKKMSFWWICLLHITTSIYSLNYMYLKNRKNVEHTICFICKTCIFKIENISIVQS